MSFSIFCVCVGLSSRDLFIFFSKSFLFLFLSFCYPYFSTFLSMWSLYSYCVIILGKYTCHTGINMGAGWIVPLAFLISNGWIRSYGCNSIRAAAEYFTKSCVPGALSSEYNTGVPYDNMCDLCHGPSFRYCRRDASEDYFGYTGEYIACVHLNYRG
jgi:Transferrin.